MLFRSADIILCKDKKNPLASGGIYISHKKEGGPEAFQQYGGLSEQAGAEIYNHKLVQKFLQQVANVLGDSQQLASPVMGTFDDPVLANMSIYGPDYGKPYSLQHTQLIGQGKPVFKETPRGVELSFSSHMSLSGRVRKLNEDLLTKRVQVIKETKQKISTDCRNCDAYAMCTSRAKYEHDHFRKNTCFNSTKINNKKFSHLLLFFIYIEFQL